MRNELLELRTALTGALTCGHPAEDSAKPLRKATLKMKVVAQDAKELDGAAD
jgi:hypothetical protein